MFDPTLIERAIQRVAENRIREAEERGLFETLPGAGKPLPALEEGPAEAHLVSWIRGWIERERMAELQRSSVRRAPFSRLEIRPSVRGLAKRKQGGNHDKAR